MTGSLAEHLYYIVYSDELPAVSPFADLTADEQRRWINAAYRLNPENSPADFDVPGLGRIPLKTLPAENIAEVGKILSTLARQCAKHTEPSARAELDGVVRHALSLLGAGTAWHPSLWRAGVDSESIIPVSPLKRPT